MSWEDLWTALLAKTSRRLLRGDAAKGQDSRGAPLTLDPAFLSRVEEDPGDLWAEYRVDG